MYIYESAIRYLHLRGMSTAKQLGLSLLLKKQKYYIRVHKVSCRFRLEGKMLYFARSTHIILQIRLF